MNESFYEVIWCRMHLKQNG